MQCNVMPESAQQGQREETARRLLGPLLIVLSVAVVLSGITSLWCYTAAQGAKQYMTDFVYPVTQQVSEHNAKEQEVKAYEKRLRDAQSKGIHWSPILVMLAETKPPDIAVQTISGETQTITVTAVGEQIDTARSWQQSLRRRAGIQDVQVKTMKQGIGGPKQFAFAVILGDKENGTTTPRHP